MTDFEIDLQNIARYTVHSIVSWPNPTQWLMIHTCTRYYMSSGSTFGPASVNKAMFWLLLTLNACTLNAHSGSWFKIFLRRSITLTLLWPRWRLKSPASRLFTQPFIQTQIKENIKGPRRHWPLYGEFTGTGEFPAQRASYAENVSIWWRHHACINWKAFGIFRDYMNKALWAISWVCGIINTSLIPTSFI